LNAIADSSGPPKGEFAKTRPIMAAVIIIIAALRSDFMDQKYPN
jgi:hypothetical protein